MKITTTWLQTRKEPRNRPKKRYEETVDGREGLMVRIYPSGATSFVYRYTLPGGRGRDYLVLGKFGAGGLSLADAFDQHHQAQRERELGLDPKEERRKRKDFAKASPPWPTKPGSWLKSTPPPWSSNSSIVGSEPSAGMRPAARG